MLSKGSELFLFEGDLFKLKQKYIDQEFNEKTWTELMKDGEELLRKYLTNDEKIDYYCFQEFATFVDYIDARCNGKFENKVRRGLLELPA